MKWSLTIFALLVFVIAAYSSAAELSTDVDHFAYDDMSLETEEDYALLERRGRASRPASRPARPAPRAAPRASRRAPAKASAKKGTHTGRALKGIAANIKQGAVNLKNKLKSSIKKDIKGVKNKIKGAVNNLLSDKKNAKKSSRGGKKSSSKNSKSSRRGGKSAKGKKAGKGSKKSSKGSKKSAKSTKGSKKSGAKAGKGSKKSAKDSKKSAKSAKDSKKADAKGKKTFKPKVQPFLSDSSKALRKSLGKVVNDEPDSAAVKQAKDNWKFENQVMHKLDKYSPPDTKNLLARKAKLQLDSADTCGLVDKSCSVVNEHHRINMNTCVMAKEACFNSQVAVHKIERAHKMCTKADEVCAKKDFHSKFDCIVEKAKCKKFLAATNYSVRAGANLQKRVRDREILDKDANDLAQKVAGEKPLLEQKKKAFEAAKPEADKCKVTEKKAQTCLDNADFGPDCSAVRVEAEKCDGPKAKFEEAKLNYEEAEKQYNKLVAERNAAEALAKKVETPTF